MTNLPPLAPNAWLRWDLVTRMLREQPPPETVVEIGIGQGGFGARLATRANQYIGYEQDGDSWAVASKRLTVFERATVRNEAIPPEPTTTADLVCAFEVLEHIEDDAGAVSAWKRWVTPGGLLMVSVPARPSAYGRMDAAVGHFRRYSAQTLEGLFREAGLIDVVVRGYGFPLGLLLDYARNHVLPVPNAEDYASGTAPSGRLFQPRDSASGLLALAVWPFRVLQRPWVASRLNTGLVAVGRTPSVA